MSDMEKVLSLVTQLYQEMTEFRNETNKRFTKIEMCLEHDIKPKMQLCLDELVTVKEKLQEHDERFDRMDERLSKMDDRFDTMDKRFDGMDKRFDKIDEKL
jgi:predicted nuclease with TOPRIM domain